MNKASNVHQLHTTGTISFGGSLLTLVGLVSLTALLLSTPVCAAAPEGAEVAIGTAVDAPEGVMDTVSTGSVPSGNSWSASIKDMPQTPPKLVMVNKNTQTLALLGKRSPMAVQQRFVCTTGQVAGDKFVSGDRRTPEGVYFVVKKIDRGLDYGEYGGIAYTLNYPSPMDKLRGKTGHGIWIHSRGRPITPMETRGCIAINLSDIDTLGPHLAVGTPVVVADTVAAEAYSTNTPENAVARLLEDKTRKWNSAWANRSPDMFGMYAPDSYSKAQQESFTAFKAQKERLFSMLPWIHIIYRDIHVLQGPDYWVTWFEQYYRAPNITTEGVRRLYWQPDVEGELRIVGMEWLPQDVGLETAYLETITPGVSTFVEQWRRAWEQADLDAYAACYAPNAVQGVTNGLNNIVLLKQILWKRAKPSKVDLTGVRVMVERGGIKVDMTQVYRDTAKGGDKGVKTITLHPKGDSWVIASEIWSALKP